MKTTTGITLFARVGYAARGVVYLLVGGLAALPVTGQGGKTTGSKGALAELLSAPLGKLLLGILAFGLVCYALWRCIQSFTDTDHHGVELKGLIVRSGLAISAVTHLTLAIFAANMIFTLGGNSSQSGGSQSTAGWLMQQPFGRWLVAAVGLAIIGVGVAHCLKGAKTKFDDHFDMPLRIKRWVYPVCQFGLMVRGLVFMVVGGFFIIAAYQINPQEAGGIAEVFDTFQKQPFGTPLMVFIAVGLFAFGTYSTLEAFYRRVDPS